MCCCLCNWIFLFWICNWMRGNFLIHYRLYAMKLIDCDESFALLIQKLKWGLSMIKGTVLGCWNMANERVLVFCLSESILGKVCRDLSVVVVLMVGWTGVQDCCWFLHSFLVSWPFELWELGKNEFELSRLLIWADWEDTLDG